MTAVCGDAEEELVVVVFSSSSSSSIGGRRVDLVDAEVVFLFQRGGGEPGGRAVAGDVVYDQCGLAGPREPRTDPAGFGELVRWSASLVSDGVPGEGFGWRGGRVQVQDGAEERDEET